MHVTLEEGLGENVRGSTVIQLFALGRPVSGPTKHSIKHPSFVLACVILGRSHEVPLTYTPGDTGGMATCGKTAYSNSRALYFNVHALPTFRAVEHSRRTETKYPIGAVSTRSVC